MDLDFLKILVERTSYINTYWNFYIVVATAIIGIFASGKIKITKHIRIIFTVAFVLFAYSNYDSIKDVNEQRSAILEQLSEDVKIDTLETTGNKKNTPQEKLVIIANKFKPNPKWQYFLFHMLLDITVLVSIWRITSHNENKNISQQNNKR